MFKNKLSFINTRGFLYLLFTLLAAPFVLELFELGSNHDVYRHFIHETGEFAARFLVITLLISPLRLLFPGSRVLKWFQKNKRAFGLFTFFLCLLHVAGYIMRNPSLSKMAGEALREPSLLLGWVAFLIFLPMALTSNNYSMRLLKGRNWKNLQRLVYPAAILVAVHWLWGEHHLNWAPVLIHFLPLLGLELFRIYRFIKTQSQMTVNA